MAMEGRKVAGTAAATAGRACFREGMALRAVCLAAREGEVRISKEGEMRRVGRRGRALGGVL